ncbi:ATP-binding protein [Ammonifex thiophilus]|uniref:ATP-binding protein n=1 Tax=Ammonifex thiophilus TaxID=444093 RepID=A0A3D8P5W9_9THEO|nr:ATP-binding protein [Ammonifex thiophilus]RDV83244.1 ATP-binding protein [Ammonifex thiophilus]
MDERIKEGLALFEEYVARRRWEFDRLKQELEEKKRELAACREKEEVLGRAREIFLLAANSAYEHARKALEKAVTSALQAVFGPEISFAIELATRREQQEADFFVISTYGGTQPVKTEPTEARGGGVVDVISLSLRSALLEHSRLPGILVLDEPGKHVSEEYARQLGEWLRTFSQETGRQILLVTHSDSLAEAGELVYRVEMPQGESRVRLLSSRQGGVENTA